MGTTEPEGAPGSGEGSPPALEALPGDDELHTGASPDAYASLFADLAARRKDLEGRRGRLSFLLAAEQHDMGQRPPQGVSESLRLALEDACHVLTDPDVPGVTKRDLLLPIVDRVVCHKEGVEVIFAPGLFD